MHHEVKDHYWGQHKLLLSMGHRCFSKLCDNWSGGDMRSFSKKSQITVNNNIILFLEGFDFMQYGAKISSTGSRRGKHMGVVPWVYVVWRVSRGNSNLIHCSWDAMWLPTCLCNNSKTIRNFCLTLDVLL